MMYRRIQSNAKEDCILILLVISSIAFIESSGPIWSIHFIGEFFLNLMTYIAVSVVALMILSPLFYENKKKNIANHVEQQQIEKQARKEKILEILRDRGSVTNDDIEKSLNVSDTTATNYLQELEREGKVEQIGERGRFVSYRSKRIL